MLKNEISMEKCSELTYLGYVIQEALRWNPPAPASSHYHFTQDVVLGDKNLKVKAYTPLIIMIMNMHRSKAMWQRPYEFIPDRFDNAKPISKTSAGEKRPITAWVPFNGGKRICFGKTFAEFALRVICTMMAQTFDFKFVDEEKHSKVP